MVTLRRWFLTRDSVPALHRGGISEGRWLGEVWVAGPLSCAKALTTLEIRALDITTLLVSYPQAIDESWPLFLVWALPRSTCLRGQTPRRDVKQSSRRVTLYAAKNVFGFSLPLDVYRSEG